MIKELKELKASGMLTKLYNSGIINNKAMILIEVDALYQQHKGHLKACEIVVLISEKLDKSITTVWRYLSEIKQG